MQETTDESLLSQDFLITLSKGRGEDVWLLNERKKAFALFEKMEIPLLKYGLGVQTNLHELNLANVDPSVDVEVSIEGDKKNKDVYAADLSTALKTHGAIVKKYMFSAVPYGKGKFTALAAAFLNSGTFVYIPRDVDASSITIDANINDGSLFDYLLIVAEENAKATVYDLVSQAQKEGFRSGIVEIIALEGAKVNYVGIQKLNKKTYQFVSKCSHAHKDAEVNWFDCELGSKTTVLNVSSDLVGSGARTNNLSMFVAEQNQHLDLNVSSRHLAPNTTSDMLSRGVTKDKGRVIFNGLVKIAQNAPNSNGFQTQNTLMLSDESRADSTPLLEIDNNDVKCSHATTMGKVDEEQLFYLMSRGLPRDVATEKIVEGFFVPLLQRANIPQLQQRIEKEIGRIAHG